MAITLGTLDPKNFIDQFKMSEIAWLRQCYCSDRTYIQSCYAPVQTHAMYGLTKDNVQNMKYSMAANPAINRFRIVTANCRYYKILCFKYNRDKDERYKQYLLAQATAYVERLQKVDVNKYGILPGDEKKMQTYRDKDSNVKRMVSSVKSVDKLMSRWLLANKMGWREAALAFYYKLYDLKVLDKYTEHAYGIAYGFAA